MANERLDRFTKLLKEIFELDKSDLDFGIYRVMNFRKTQIEEFLAQRLPLMVQETLAPFAQGSKEEIRAQMTQIEESVVAMGMTVDVLPDTAPMKQKYGQLQKQLAEGADLAALETDVYSALYSFFSRYYEDGDFVSKRRYKEGVYAIPYEGEEVKLYWANQDQYYIKTSENFKDYTFVFDGISVHFRLVDATTEQNNNKESKDSKRAFMLFTEDEENYPGIKTFEYDADAGEIVIRFVYDIPADKKKKYAEENYAAITKWLLSLRRAELNPLIAPIPTGKGKETTTLLEKHLKGYVAKNTFDYFIHKDLRGFLTRELDFFIKSEVMHLEDLDTGSEARVETYLAKIKAIKRVGKIIIDFLAQIEDFQKKLWLKKKFVVETNWCITLDKIDESFWAEIIANKAQIEEWIAMYAIDEADGWSNPPTVDFLRQNQNLIVDTQHFNNTFVFSLLESIPRIDDTVGMIMLHSDNQQALQLIKEKYEGKIKSIFIDPPYNTGDDGFIYKDGYSSSSWLSMLSDRITVGEPFLTNDGVMFICTGDEEQEYLASYIRNTYGKKRYFANLVWEKKKKGSFLSGNIAKMKDYIACVAKDDEHFPGLIGEIATEEETYPCVNASNPRDIRTISTPIVSKYREKNYTLPKGNVISAGNMNLILHSNLIIKEGMLVPPLQIEGNWRYSQTSMDEYAEHGELYITQDLYLRRIVKEPRYKRLKDLLLRTSENEECDFRKIDLDDLSKNGWGSNEDANDELLQIMGEQYAVSYPKPIKLVAQLLCSTRQTDGYYMDYFAGSGTTGQAIVQLNRLDGFNRKCILVDMGQYMESVAKPRMKKCIYAPEWKSGKPQQRDSGVSQIIKYMRLESYEDALSNIELSDDGGQLAALLGEEYLIHYMVDLESRGSLLDVEAFSNPFAYTMKITEKNECKERSIDLCETFNYLIGLTVKSQSAISYWLSKPAETPAYEGAVDLVSDISGQYAFRQIEGALPDGRRALVIWRTVTDDVIESNAALDAYFTTYRKNAQDRKYDVIFVNGDSNLENLRRSNEGWTVQMTEIEFKKRMFEEV